MNYKTSIEEAIEVLELKKHSELNDKAFSAYTLAIEALKKQLPIETLPNYSPSSGITICPSCGTYTPPACQYCNHCGQKIKRDIE